MRDHHAFLGGLTETLTHVAFLHADLVLVLHEAPRAIDIHVRVAAVVLRCLDRRIVEEVRLVDDFAVDRLQIAPR